MQISVTLPTLMAFILTTNYITFLLTYIITRREASQRHRHKHSRSP